MRRAHSFSGRSLLWSTYHLKSASGSNSEERSRTQYDAPTSPTILRGVDSTALSHIGRNGIVPRRPRSTIPSPSSMRTRPVSAVQTRPAAGLSANHEGQPLVGQLPERHGHRQVSLADMTMSWVRLTNERIMPPTWHEQARRTTQRLPYRNERRHQPHVLLGRACCTICDYGTNQVLLIQFPPTGAPDRVSANDLHRRSGRSAHLT